MSHMFILHGASYINRFSSCSSTHTAAGTEDLSANMLMAVGHLAVY